MGQTDRQTDGQTDESKHHGDTCSLQHTLSKYLTVLLNV